MLLEIYSYLSPFTAVVCVCACVHKCVCMCERVVCTHTERVPVCLHVNCSSLSMQFPCVRVETQ